jgi:RNA polymerase sigma factor (sigma-70 family)
MSSEMTTTWDGSFSRFFEAHYAGICRALWLGLGQDSDPEDAAQEAFARAFQKWNAVSKLDRPATWVFVVAVREARRQQRRRDRASATSRWNPEHPDPSAGVEARMAIVAALGYLAPRQRMAIVLRYYADLSVKQIASAMQCREGTVKATLHAALGILRTLQLDDPTTTEVTDDRQ